MSQRQDRPVEGFWRELQNIANLGRQVGTLVSGPHRGALGLAVMVMAFGSAASTAIPLYLGKLVDSVNPETSRGLSQEAVTRAALGYLAVIGLAYLLREGLNVLRRYLVENACTRIDRDMCVRLVSH